MLGYLGLLASCADEASQKLPSVEANDEAILDIRCAFGCEDWKDFESEEDSSSLRYTKTVRITGQAMDDLKELKLADRCATTPNVLVQISTDTGFQQQWTIAVSPDDQPTGMCTVGRDQAAQAKFDAFFAKHIVGSE